MPDLILIGLHGVAWLEVKSAGDDLSPGQVRWKYALQAVGQDFYLVTEVDLRNCAVDDILDGLA